MASDHADREHRVVLEAYRSISGSVSVGAATVLLLPEAPGSPMLNRILGLGLASPASEHELDEAIGAVPPGTTYYVAVEPGARPAELRDWLRARGLEPSWGWMRFHRGLEIARTGQSGLRLQRVDRRSADIFARIVRIGFDLPEAVDAALRRAVDSPWEFWVALAGDEPAGVAGLYAAEGVGYLGLGATLPEHRGKGAQSLLLRHRIARAVDAGCDLLVTETGELRDDRPSGSYRNLLRAGFYEVAVTANWLGRA
jgi:GNAT superfamily N-acetyltransferase